MLIYEINLEVSEDINYKVAGWLMEHVQQIFKNKGFQALQWYFRVPEDEGRDSQAEKQTLWTLQYLVEDRSTLDDYLNNAEPAMKKELIDQYGDQVRFSRRVLNLLRLAGPAYEQAMGAPPGFPEFPAD